MINPFLHLPFTSALIQLVSALQIVDKGLHTADESWLNVSSGRTLQNIPIDGSVKLQELFDGI